MDYLNISGGTVYDPANDVDGVVQDLWIAAGKMVAAPSLEKTDSVRTIDATGMVVMPGGIDMHCHIAGPKVNAGRKMQPRQYDDSRHASRVGAAGEASTTCSARQIFHSGGMGSVPTLITTGYRYIGLGYTTCFDAAISPMTARQVHHEFNQVPNVDTGFYTLVGNNHFAMNAIAAGDTAAMDSFLGWMMRKVGAWAPKIVNPGGVEIFKSRRPGNATDLDQLVDGFNVTPRQITAGICQAANRIGLPHPVHIHTNNLGMPGNWETTLETMKTIGDQKAHLTHIQFHSYGGGDADQHSICSMTGPLAQWVNDHPNLTVDVGQVMFGPTTSMTGDGPLGHYLQQISGDAWYCSDVELESGCGVSPITYRDTNFVHALQWAIGLEWYLMVDDPWQVVMSTDHPNGGSFAAYPQIIRLLMDRDYRREKLASVNPKILQHSCLADLDREYSLREIAIITRSGPARILGLNSKGHLGPGADADITIYTPDRNFETMFAVPRYVIKSGQVVVRDHELCMVVTGNTISCDTGEIDAEHAASIESWIDANYSIHPSHYGIGEGEFARVLRV